MYKLFKRVIDIFVATVFLIGCSPIILLISIFIKLDSTSDPIIYKGNRAFDKQNTFNLYKFRTMVPHKETLGNHSTALNDERLTGIGKFLRKFKLDELPQFFNVLLGSMSLVGPRPQVTYYTNKYEGEFKDILSVKPGITDLASLHFMDMDKILGDQNVNNRYEKEIEPIKNQLRLAYVKNMSFRLDLNILILTFLKLFKLVNKKTVNNFLKKYNLLKNGIL